MERAIVNPVVETGACIRGTSPCNAPAEIPVDVHVFELVIVATIPNGQNHVVVGVGARTRVVTLDVDSVKNVPTFRPQQNIVIVVAVKAGFDADENVFAAVVSPGYFRPGCAGIRRSKGVRYVPARRTTVSPAEALAFAVDREQQEAPERGVALLAFAQDAAPVGLTQ